MPHLNSTPTPCAATNPSSSKTLYYRQSPNKGRINTIQIIFLCQFFDSRSDHGMMNIVGALFVGVGYGTVAGCSKERGWWFGWRWMECRRRDGGNEPNQGRRECGLDEERLSEGMAEKWLRVAADES